MSDSSTRPEFAPVKVRYSEAVRPEKQGDALNLTLFTDGERSGASAEIDLKEPALVRDAMLTMADVLASDLRFKATDRSDYLAYLLKQGQRATKELWDAQQSFLERRYAEEAAEEAPLDPLLTVSKEGIALEVFSADESAYARLELRSGEAYEGNEISEGTTQIDLMAAVGGITELRSYRSAKVNFQASAEDAKSREIQVPYRWVRALGQMQAASTLPATEFEVAPIDFYNLLFTLRTQRAKKSPRALRYELVPGQAPRMVLEPWELVIEGSGEPYQGSKPAVVRTWGRRRLSLLARILPHCKSVKIRLVGGGLPAFYIFDLGVATLTLALSGWTDSGWAGIATFDLFGGEPDTKLASKVEKSLKKGPKTLAALTTDVGADEAEVRNALLSKMQTGDIVHGLSDTRFHYRPLFASPIDVENVRYRDENEEAAHRLLATPGQVRITTVHDLGGEGVRIEGEVEDKQAHRTFLTSFTIDREGRTVDASCTSPQFRRSGLREGPTVPMIAIRLQFARERAELERARGTKAGRKLIRAETRMLIRRQKDKLTLMRVSLNDKKVIVRWGPEPDAMRMTQQVFSSRDEARDDYFNRLSSCADRGFIDASAAESL